MLGSRGKFGIAPLVMRAIVVFAGLMIALGVAVARFASQADIKPAPSAMSARTAAPAQPTTSAGYRSVVLQRDPRGHFHTDGRVDGRRISFMVDTGASVIALTARDAARLSIHPARSEFTAQVKTANGTVRAAPVRLSTVEVGGLTVRDVAALVIPDEALSENLLGMSFLSRLRRWEYAGGKLVLEQ
jgi:aspartyl protease family protein